MDNGNRLVKDNSLSFIYIYLGKRGREWINVYSPVFDLNSSFCVRFYGKILGKKEWIDY